MEINKQESMWSLSAAAKDLGVSRVTVGELVRLHEIETHQLPFNFLGKGLNDAGMSKLRQLLNKPARRERATSA